MPLLFASTYVFKEAIKSSFQEVRTQVAQLNTFLAEHISVSVLFNISLGRPGDAQVPFGKHEVPRCQYPL
jgi:hypothetical protein